MTNNNVSRLKYEETGGIKGMSKKGLKKNFYNHVIKSTGESSLRNYFWQGTILTLFSNFPSAAGSVLRGRVYNTILGHVGSNCFVEKDVRFNIPQNVFLGDRILIEKSCFIDILSKDGKIHINNDVFIARYSTIRAGPKSIYIDEGAYIGPFSYIIGTGGLKIGKNTLIAKNNTIMTESHDYTDPSVPIKFQDIKLKGVQIGDDVWLGADVVVLPGVTIRDGSVVGAGAVVTEDIPPYSVAVGNPAKVIKKRE